MHKILVLFAIVTIAGCQPKTNSKNAFYNYDVESRLDSLGIVLPELSAPVANYVHVVKTGNLLFLAGKGSRTSNGELLTGKLGDSLDVQVGYEAARRIGVTQLAVIKNEIGDLNRVVRIVKVMGMVNATPDFKEHPEVVNGFSDLMVEVFGDRGKHARSAVGMGSLPRNLAVEIELIVEVE